MQEWELVAQYSTTYRLKIDGGYLYQVCAYESQQVVFVPDLINKQHSGE